MNSIWKSKKRKKNKIFSSIVLSLEQCKVSLIDNILFCLYETVCIRCWLIAQVRYKLKILVFFLLCFFSLFLLQRIDVKRWYQIWEKHQPSSSSFRELYETKTKNEKKKKKIIFWIPVAGEKSKRIYIFSKSTCWPQQLAHRNLIEMNDFFFLLPFGMWHWLSMGKSPKWSPKMMKIPFQLINQCLNRTIWKIHSFHIQVIFFGVCVPFGSFVISFGRFFSLSLLLALFTFRWMALNKTLINTPCGGNKKFYFEWDSAPCCAVCKSECTKLNCWRFFFFSRFFFFFFFWKSHSRKFPFVKYYLHWNQESVEKSHRVCLSMM